MVLWQLSPSLAPWPRGGDMGAGAAWDSSAAAWHASCRALCPYPPWDGAGTDPASYFWCLACGCWGWGTPSPKGTRGSLTQVQWEAHRGQAGKGGVKMQSQTSSNSSLSLLAVPASNVPMIWQPQHPWDQGAPGAGCDVDSPWGMAPQAAMGCRMLCLPLQQCWAPVPAQWAKGQFYPTSCFQTHPFS